MSLLLFFLQLTIQMRLDRLDGVGEVVWAEDYCLEGVVAGFFEGVALWEAKTRSGVPSEGEIRGLLRSFARDEWLDLMEECLETYEFSSEESSLIHEYGDAHLDKLHQVLATLG